VNLYPEKEVKIESASQKGAPMVSKEVLGEGRLSRRRGGTFSQGSVRVSEEIVREKGGGYEVSRRERTRNKSARSIKEKRRRRRNRIDLLTGDGCRSRATLTFHAQEKEKKETGGIRQGCDGHPSRKKDVRGNEKRTARSPGGGI